MRGRGQPAPFYFSHPELFLIPVEHLGPAGMIDAFSAKLVLLDASRMHPYFQPFEGMTDLAYASDFDPTTSSVENAAYQLLFAERLGADAAREPRLDGGPPLFMFLSRASR